MTGTNTYAGRTLVKAGILAIHEDANLGAGDRVELNTGHLDIRRDLVSGKTVATESNRLRLNGHQVEFWALEGNANVFSGTEDHLTVTSGAFDYISWQLGKLTLLNAHGGHVVLNDGWDAVLKTNGSLDQIDSLPTGSPPTIEVGPDFAELSVGTFFAFGYNLLHVRVGPAECDHIEVRDHFNFNSANDDIQLRFEDVGGLETGYRLGVRYDIGHSELFEVPTNATHFQTPRLLISPNQVEDYGLWAVNGQGRSKHIERVGVLVPDQTTSPDMA